MSSLTSDSDWLRLFDYIVRFKNKVSVLRRLEHPLLIPAAAAGAQVVRLRVPLEAVDAVDVEHVTARQQVDLLRKQVGQAY